MGSYVVPLDETDRTQVAVVGGKGANLGELSRIDGIRVPAGFCVTTAAFRRIVDEVEGFAALMAQLSGLDPDDREAISARSEAIRQAVEQAVIPDEVSAAITGALAGLGERTSCAVRSSATAEDLAGASFAGQQDSYLDVVGSAAVLEHIGRCWASLFTERAVSYRLRNGFDHRTVDMAVIVQRMVGAEASGVMFTADPVTSNRKVVSVEATPGLGDALVSGLVNADVYKVRDGRVVDMVVAAEQPVLSERQVVLLAGLGRRVEAHFGCPQDIEWCLDDGGYHLVQSRPITTLFPIPDVDDGADHVYLSVGHQQMMTDPMKPLGISLWQLTSRAPMHEAGSRLFVDATRARASPTSRASLLDVAGRSDPLLADALQTVVERDFIPLVADGAPAGTDPGRSTPMIDADPAIVPELIAGTESSVAALRREIRTRAGVELIDFILADIQELQRLLFDPRSTQVFMTAMEATWWLDEHLQEWLGDKGAADTLTQSVPHNVTSEMGLALFDVVDAIRPHAEVVAFLERVEGEGFLDELGDVEGGREARDAIRRYLDTYGMRCVGEIDVTRPRWSECPTMLLPLILSNIRNFEAGAGRRRFELGRDEAARKEQEVLERLRELADGASKAGETKQMIDRVRTFIGYREHPKFGMVSRYFVYKQALLEEAERLVGAGVLDDAADIFFLTFGELHDVVRSGEADHELIRHRQEAFSSHRALRPPRVLTSDGEAITGSYRRDDLSPGVLVGLAVSAGVVEGRARVILDMADADLEPGDILVTAHTDPSWSPLFVTAAGLVTEVGGLMTHGAVVAREYGLPAVVGVERATVVIQDGQRIRVDGTDGHVEVVSPA